MMGDSHTDDRGTGRGDTYGEDNRSWWQRWQTRLLVLGLIVVVLVVNIILVQQERTRAIRAECQAVNKSISKIRLAVIDVAGYQAPITPTADETLRTQIASSNAARRAFAEQKAKGIPSLICPDGKSNRDLVRSGTTHTTKEQQP